MLKLFHCDADSLAERLRMEIGSYHIAEGALVAGRFVVLKHVADGGMGSVYLAKDNLLNIKVALKVLHRELANDKGQLKRFKQEIKLLKQVSHPNIVKPFELIETNDFTLLSMEYINAQTLEDLLQDGPLAVEKIPGILIEICEGLKRIHKAGIIHRDLKPGNVFLCGDTIKIVDFGISKDKNTKRTKKNVKVGSFEFIAPELWKGAAPSKKSDFYALGVLAYELATGITPFFSKDPLEMMKMHVNYEPKSAQEVNSKVPRWLDKLILRLLSKKPSERFESAEDIIDFIQTYDVTSYSIQRFPTIMAKNTIRSGAAMMSVFSSMKNTPERENTIVREQKRKSMVLALKATNSYSQGEIIPASLKKRKKTVTIKLPKRAALVFEFEPPTLDFLFLGVFLASLNMFDGYLTNQGVARFGTEAEGNILLKNLMHSYDPELVLFWTKVFAISIVFVLTILARKSKRVKNLVATLSCLYLFAAIIPWLFILYVLN